jgi:hypothetical protein
MIWLMIVGDAAKQPQGDGQSPAKGDRLFND